MKKSFLIVGALGAILSTNGYAVGSQSEFNGDLECPAGCILRVSVDGSHFSATCVYSSNYEFCAEPKVVNVHPSQTVALTGVFTQEIKKPIEDKKTGTDKKTNVARAARVVKDVNVANAPLMPIDTEPEIQDKVASGSGETVVRCPTGCELVYVETGKGQGILKCKKPNGELCQETVITYEPTIHR